MFEKCKVRVIGEGRLLLERMIVRPHRDLKEGRSPRSHKEEVTGRAKPLTETVPEAFPEVRRKGGGA